ncbi:MAG TPA: hypothetical protein VKC53_04365 [Patescibacteria group bacterium]|nr:hypothetical protein [Patescibacteria group bacterium]
MTTEADAVKQIYRVLMHTHFGNDPHVPQGLKEPVYAEAAEIVKATQAKVVLSSLKGQVAPDPKIQPKP